ncbi:MAG TPA: hypothetical protein VFF79_14915 [Conexibacter sp.]|nr:hypothetical protein [Conexibacter sp.]
MKIVAVLALPAAGAIVFYTIVGGSLSDFGVATMVAAGAFALGASLGFLFGIPRTLAAGGRVQHVAAPGAETGNAADAAPANDGRLHYQPNTNLEDISDWLTKILVGAGLVGLTRVVHSVGRLADQIATAFGARAGEHGAAWAFSLGLLVAFGVTGFLSGYLYTRLRLQASFARADDINTLTQAVIERVDADKIRDAEALALVGSQLNPIDTPPTARELDAAVAAASDGMRKQIFNRARDQRRASRGKVDDESKQKVARTIPVFRALIAADPDERYFRNHAELGFALHDQTPPDDAAAEASLSKAIEIRDRLKKPGYLRYEWTRALCRMAVPAGDQASRNELILADLRRAASDPKVAALIRSDATVVAWCQSNNLALDDVVPPPPPSPPPPPPAT